MSVDLTVECTAGACAFSMSLVLQSGLVFPTASCPFCGGRMTIRAIQPTGSAESAKRQSIRDFTEMSEDYQELDWFAAHLKAHESGQLGKRRLSGFMNRFIGPMLLLETLENMGGRAQADVLHTKVTGCIVYVRNLLLPMEKSYAIGRGERLSDGLSLLRDRTGRNIEPPALSNIVVRNMIGVHADGIVSEHALPFLLGWVEKGEAGVCLTASGRSVLASANGSVEMRLSRSIPEGPGAPSLNYIGDDQVYQIMDTIRLQAVGDAELMRYILEQVQNNALNGWSSGNLAETILKANNPEVIAWWNDEEGKNRAVIEHRRGRGPEAGMKKFLGLVNAQLGGTQQRMKELGLVSSIRRGRTKHLIPTSRTETAISMLDEWGIAPMPT